MWVKCFKGKYYPTSKFLQCEDRKNSSWTWKGLMAGRSFLIENVCFRVGARSLVHIWEDLWVPYLRGFRPSPRANVVTSLLALVSSLLDSNGFWNYSLLEEMFEAQSIAAIKEVHWITSKLRIRYCGFQPRMVLFC